MRVAYFDCFAGVSGDMALGALVDAGLDVDQFLKTIQRLELPGCSVAFQREVRGYLSGTRAEVRVEKSDTHRHLPQIEALIRGASLDAAIQEKAIAVFRRLAVAEAAVHGIRPEQVHFHEVGALDAILDIVGTVAGLFLLGVERVYSSPLPLGSGFVKCAHGTLPLPAPAVVELVRGFEVLPRATGREVTTPTGAAIITTLVDGPAQPEALVVEEVGYGFGRHEGEKVPNALRLLLGSVPEGGMETVVLLETNLDDVTGEVAGHLIERSLEEGALDAFVIPIQMKKSRPGMLFSALVPLESTDKFRSLIHRESGTLGVRIQRLSRSVVEREILSRETSLGRVRVKRSSMPGLPDRLSPEYDDAARIARERGLPLRLVLDRLHLELGGLGGEE